MTLVHTKLINLDEIECRLREARQKDIKGFLITCREIGLKIDGMDCNNDSSIWDYRQNGDISPFFYPGVQPINMWLTSDSDVEYHSNEPALLFLFTSLNGVIYLEIPVWRPIARTFACSHASVDIRRPEDAFSAYRPNSPSFSEVLLPPSPNLTIPQILQTMRVRLTDLLTKNNGLMPHATSILDLEKLKV